MYERIKELWNSPPTKGRAEELSEKINEIASATSFTSEQVTEVIAVLLDFETRQAVSVSLMDEILKTTLSCAVSTLRSDPVDTARSLTAFLSGPPWRSLTAILSGPPWQQQGGEIEGQKIPTGETPSEPI